MPTTGGDVAHGDFSMLVALGLVLGLVAGIYLLDRSWQRRQSEHERTTGVQKQSHAFSLNLVRHFMPSFKVQKYQFRGMQAKAGTADIAFDDLSLELASGRRVLDGVTGHFVAGRLCAIMGPSGAGKTTFMNVLCGKATYGKMGGTIKINNVPSDISAFRSVTGFVPQDDIVHQDLTVSEQIEFSARLRNKVGTTRKSINAITQDVLNVMQIDHIQNSIVGSVESRGISGGQRKRVNIGLELAAQPTVLFLDEPTSGLDSTSSLAVALSLKKMCQLGMTSIMVIHQPRYSLFTLFDDVLLLGKGGKTVYLGHSGGAKAYFEACGFEPPGDENPADWFMDVISGEVANQEIPDFRPDMLFDMWEKRVSDCLSRQPTLTTEGGREVNDSDDLAILAHTLSEEWHRIDTNGDGVVSSDELHRLLANCSNVKPDAEVVSELMERMAGTDAKSVTKKQFTEYLCSLRGDVARDANSSERMMGLRSSSSSLTESDSEVGVDGVDPELGDNGQFPAGLAAAQPRIRSMVTAPLDPLRGLKRDTPGHFEQCRILALRRLVQWWRMNTQRALFLAALALGAVVLAVLDAFMLSTPRWSCMALLNLHTALALLLAIFCLQVFGGDQPMFWRESASGISVPAYFFARLSVNNFDIIVQSFVFTSVYFLIRQPGVPFWVFFLPFLFTAFVASGWGYLVSTLLPPKHGPFVVSLIVFIVCGLLGNPSSLAEFLNGGAVEFVVSMLSITRWSIAMNFVQADDILQPHPENMNDKYMLEVNKDVFSRRDFGIGVWWTAGICLLAMGVVLRIASFLGLRFMHRDKQV